MKPADKTSWLMGRVQQSLFPHLNQCLPTLPAEQEERLSSILEIVPVERHVPKNVRCHRCPGRKPLDRQACAKAFAAKAIHRRPTTRDLRRALQSAVNLRLTCGFATAGDVPSDSALSRAFAEFAAGCLGSEVHDALVKEWLAEELAGHVGRDSAQPLLGARGKPTNKVAQEPKKPRKRGCPIKGGQRDPAMEKRIGCQVRQSAEEATGELPTTCRTFRSLQEKK